jgi:predicted NAD/FAD-binding protein
LEYNATNLNGLFCQRRNLVSPRFLGMIRDLLRFYRSAPAVLSDASSDLTLEDYLTAGDYGTAFKDDHLLPMASALWSCPPGAARTFPVRHLVQFMTNHQMLQITGRPTWRVVRGGSSKYVSALRSRWNVEEHLSLPVRGVRRTDTHVEVRTDCTVSRFDHVIIACHSDQALRLLSDPSPAERDILAAITYQRNDAVLHTDPNVLPSKRSTWAAWNVLTPNDGSGDFIVSYCMNLLQGLNAPQPFIVSLNPGEHIHPGRILRRMTYEHPVFTQRAVAAQRRKAEIQGSRRTWYAGAYWGWGFHEDGMRSAVAIAQAFGIPWPTTQRATTVAQAA